MDGPDLSLTILLVLTSLLFRRLDSSTKSLTYLPLLPLVRTQPSVFHGLPVSESDFMGSNYLEYVTVVREAFIKMEDEQ